MEQRENAVGVCIAQCTQGTHYLSKVDITALCHARIRQMQRWEEGARGGFEGPWFRPWLRLNRATSIRWKLAADSPKIKLHFSTRADPFLFRRGRGRGRRRRTKTISLVE